MNTLKVYAPRVVELLEAVPYRDAHEETLGIVTLRMPQSTHAALKEQAHELGTNLNTLLLSRAIAAIVNCELLPTSHLGRMARREWQASLRQQDHENS